MYESTGSPWKGASESESESRHATLAQVALDVQSSCLKIMSAMASVSILAPARAPRDAAFDSARESRVQALR